MAFAPLTNVVHICAYPHVTTEQGNPYTQSLSRGVKQHWSNILMTVSTPGDRT